MCVVIYSNVQLLVCSGDLGSLQVAMEMVIGRCRLVRHNGPGGGDPSFISSTYTPTEIHCEKCVNIYCRVHHFRSRITTVTVSVFQQQGGDA